MPSVGSLYCCGWKELHNMRLYKGDLRQLLRDLIRAGALTQHGPRGGAFLLNQVGVRARPAYGAQFARDIHAAKLGKVKRLPSFTNPNTGHLIRPFVWYPDIRAVLDYCQEQKLLPTPKV